MHRWQVHKYFRLFPKHICKSLPTEHRQKATVCYLCNQEGASYDSHSNHSLHTTKKMKNKYLRRFISLKMNQNIHDAGTQKENTKILAKICKKGHNSYVIILSQALHNNYLRRSNKASYLRQSKIKDMANKNRS